MANIVATQIGSLYVDFINGEGHIVFDPDKVDALDNPVLVKDVVGDLLHSLADFANDMLDDGESYFEVKLIGAGE